MNFVLKTSAFQAGAEIPAKYTCAGADISPALSWSGTPAGTASLALVVDDPDAPSGMFNHWVLFGLKPQEEGLPEGVPKTEQLANGAVQGRNGFGRIGWGGPCPPPGKPHRYFFKLFALDNAPNLKAGANRQELEHAMQGHIVGQAELMGTFKR